MKLIAIGDLHGRDVWKKVDTTAADKIIFLGDYTDSRQGYTDAAIYQNLLEIIRLKQQYPAKIVLLIGNHDAQYLHYPRYGCSGFRLSAQPALSALFNQYNHLFQIAFQQGRYLFTHAGVSTVWYQYVRAVVEQMNDETPLADQLNTMHRCETAAHFLFDVGRVRGGSQAYGGPVWADRTETIHDHLAGYHQVVGHTPVSDIITVGNTVSSITYCDVTQTRARFYETTL